MIKIKNLQQAVRLKAESLDNNRNNIAWHNKAFRQALKSSLTSKSSLLLSFSSGLAVGLLKQQAHKKKAKGGLEESQTRRLGRETAAATPAVVKRLVSAALTGFITSIVRGGNSGNSAALAEGRSANDVVNPVETQAPISLQ